ncbi:hypothetical protein GGR53DRAFT_461229 [Hypoxylon sp. FL1150]|nr:hypothetical protein GGR53DRAFT_461229 [Hypoxylon sp. FL1150]
MLWPLVMWGSEEKDPEEREWIKSQILRMEKVATNAKITGQVLEEVQKRQDATNARKDTPRLPLQAIRRVIYDKAASRFAATNPETGMVFAGWRTV